MFNHVQYSSALTYLFRPRHYATLRGRLCKLSHGALGKPEECIRMNPKGGFPPFIVVALGFGWTSSTVRLRTPLPRFTARLVSHLLVQVRGRSSNAAPGAQLWPMMSKAHCRPSMWTLLPLRFAHRARAPGTPFAPRV
ncbi:hypothetical protein PYCCODRAFT_623667 [Trametes coccinea BRFM310]|uniref:Uncharacterized protein n=1 Tax=Trametes coccinea (strain BRFM310) TaxID=1353009 RepID=A0A1Y2J2A7_TRAC3|nr:hypothetical protein PYCCODRAFT_623667 [Trametes coccinea BRFM310]